MADNGDARQKYERWVTCFSGELYRLAYRLCGQAEVAEDLLQETFYHAWRSMASLKDEGRARAWLFQILRFRWSHYVRSETRRPSRGPALDSVMEPADPDPTEPLTNMAREESMQLALDALEERYRLPLLMVFVEGMTCREAAGELEIPLGTVLSRIHRARKVLRQQLGDGENAAAPQSKKKRPLIKSQDLPQLRLGGER
ncbi:MAG: RNA polymerase sigma factor [Phycisphaeraceae bacterium]